ncbi:MAG: beta-ketoacyl-ACP synthase II [Clostridiales bacterium]
MKKRVVITGLGAITSLGIDDFWESIKKGQNGISYIERIDVSDLPTKVGAEIKNFTPTDFIEKKEVKRMDRFTQFALAATQIAIEKSNVDINKVNKDRFGVLVGSGIGGIETLEKQYKLLLEKGPSRVSPFFISKMIANMASANIAIKYGARGYNECIVTACASSTNSIGEAFKIIQRNDADIIITGGTEAPITRLAFSGFCSNKTMTKTIDPSKASRPFNFDRDGFVMGEGAGILVIEELEHALNRNANIIAEIIGYGCTNDAYHITAISNGGEGSSKCMKMAIEDAEINISDIDYINAHGTSTQLNDKNETLSIKSLFKEKAYEIPISSTKSMTGHLLGAAGAIETYITSMALNEGFLPPTINYNKLDPECNLNYIPNTGVKKNIKFALTNSFGFGGHNAVLALKKYDNN